MSQTHYIPATEIQYCRVINLIVIIILIIVLLDNKQKNVILGFKYTKDNHF